MQYYAQVKNNIVMNVVAGDPTGRFQDDIVWVKCDVGTKIGDVYNDIDGQISKTQLTLQQEIELSLKNVNDICQAFMQGLLSNYPQYELYTWPMQLEEAQALLADPNAPAPLLRALAAQRHADLFILAKKVMGHNQMFRYVSGMIIGKRQYFEDVLNGCTSYERLLVIRQQIQTWKDKGVNV